LLFGCVNLVEQCCNLLKPTCKNTDVVVYILLGSEKIPLCHKCWCELAELDVEWGEEGLKNGEKHNLAE